MTDLPVVSGLDLQLSTAQLLILPRCCAWLINMHRAACCFFDAPLGRSPQEAWQGALSTMVGGELAALERISPLPAAFASTIQTRGALGNGHRLKLVNSLTSLGDAALYSEAPALAVEPDSTPGPSTPSCARAACTARSIILSWAGSSQAIVTAIPTR
jgi:NAD binding domain of 6-phosphogluconate dehydrogenase